MMDLCERAIEIISATDDAAQELAVQCRAIEAEGEQVTCAGVMKEPVKPRRFSPGI